MSYRLILKPSAEKQLADLTKSLQRRIVEKLAQLETEPRMSGTVKLTGARNCYRVRVGNYRIVYAIDDANNTVHVTIIAHRRDVYRGL
ncbi:MAG TPA: type II toxin-antitoxin system RelE/ParE family toxin [Tepidisphaeraceae bacterium]|nr:type II toxin-antitoxin system RelE/ParE family toxin [Tepidisphaeraceae bacterium]